MLVGLQRRLIYFPFPAQVPRAEAVVAGAGEVTLRTVDNLALGAWLVEAGEPDRGVAVLVASGNAGNRSLRAPLGRALASAGLAVLLFDYRGYGGNPARPSTRRPDLYFARRSSTSRRWDGSTIHSCPSGRCFATATRSPTISRA